MISLKRKKTGELVKATGITDSWRMYKPNQTKDFKISRSRFDDFMTCPRCFYLKVNRGFMSPSTPGWTLNTLTDTLLKKEFDECREKQIPHRIMTKYNLEYLVPYASDKILYARYFVEAATEGLVGTFGIKIDGQEPVRLACRVLKQLVEAIQVHIASNLLVYLLQLVLVLELEKA